MRLALRPICFSSVENEPDINFDGAALLCPDHGQFKITKRATDVYKGYTASQWETQLIYAKEIAAPGRFPTVDLV